MNGSLGVVVAFMAPQDVQREQTEIADANPNVVCRLSIPRPPSLTLLCLESTKPARTPPDREPKCKCEQPTAEWWGPGPGVAGRAFSERAEDALPTDRLQQPERFGRGRGAPRPGATYSRMGAERSQVAGPNARAREGRSGPNVREGAG